MPHEGNNLWNEICIPHKSLSPFWGYILHCGVNIMHSLWVTLLLLWTPGSVPFWTLIIKNYVLHVHVDTNPFPELVVIISTYALRRHGLDGSYILLWRDMCMSCLVLIGIPQKCIHVLNPFVCRNLYWHAMFIIRHGPGPRIFFRTKSDYFFGG